MTKSSAKFLPNRTEPNQNFGRFLISMYKNERNHEIDVIKTAVRQVCFDIKSKSTSSESTKRIIAQVFGVYPNEVLILICVIDTQV